MTPELTCPSAARPALRRLRVAVLNRIFTPRGGGAERYSIAMVEALAQQHEIHVFAQSICHQWPGVTYHTIATPLRKPRWINQVWFAAATWWATRKGFDVVHSHENTWHGNVQTVHVLPVKHNLFKQKNGGRRLLTYVSVALSPRLLTYLALERLRFSDATHRQIVVTSASLRDVVQATYPVCADLMTIIPPGFTLPEPPAPSNAIARRATARATLALPQKAVCLLFVANDWRKKGLTTVLNALAMLPVHHVLAVVGCPSQVPAFGQQTSALHLHDRVFFLGSLDDVGIAYQAADCLVHPTREDTFAMVVLEAMAHGLPVAVSSAKFCGISQLLTHRSDAWILDDPHDASALHDALVELIGDKALRATLCVNAAEFATHYQWTDMAVVQNAVYRLAAVQRC